MSLNNEQALELLEKMTPIMEKHLGDDVFVPEGIKEVPRAPTGLTVVDHIFGGGIPWGCFIEVFGPESTGKSTFAAQVGAAIQKADENNRVLYLDFEHTADKLYFSALGLDVNKPRFVMAQPTTMEEGALIAKLFLQNGLANYVVWDTLGASQPASVVNAPISEKELREGIKDIEQGKSKRGQIGLHAAATAQILAFLRPLVATQGAILCIPNQTRTKIDTWGASETTPGGLAPKFHASIRVRLSKASTTKESVDDEFMGVKQATAVENVVQFHTLKNKTAPPFRKALVRLAYGRGFLELETLLDLMVKRKIVKQGGGGNFELPGGAKVRGTQAVLDHWEANPDDLKKAKDALKKTSPTPDEIEVVHDPDEDGTEDIPEGQVEL